VALSPSQGCGPRRDLAGFGDLGEKRPQQIDRYEHVAGQLLAVATRLGGQQRANSEELAVGRYQRSAAPVRVRRSGVDGGFQKVFP
jgi:hypothetical protein